MRLPVLVAFLCFAHLVTGQELLNQPVSVTLNNLDIEKCLGKIEQASGISFSYNSKQISAVDTRISATFKNEPLRNVLDEILKNTAFAYKEIGNQVTIYEIKGSGETAVLTGYIRNAVSREEIAGAKIYFPDLAIGCISNSYGYYAIELPKGQITFRASSLGMKLLKDTIELQQDMVLNVLLHENSIELTTVSITSQTDSLYAKIDPIDIANVDKTTITREAVLRLPASAGEVDLLKFVQQFPGVHAANDGGANFQVRGSAPGNNQILLDEIPIYHPTHMLGVYSVINMDAIKSADLYKDYIPARFGSRNAAVLSVQTKEGDLQKHHLTGGISFISARMNIEGPIIKNKASFYISGRKSLFPGVGDRLLNTIKFSYPRYYDLHAKVNFHINSNNRIYFTGYFGQDQLADTLTQYKWGNIAGAFRWNHIYNAKTFSNLSLTHSEFNYAHGSDYNLEDGVYGQKVVTDKINYHFTNFYRSDLRIDYGAEVSWIRTRKGNRAEKITDLFLERSAFETGFYASADKKISPRLNLKAGVRIPFSFHIGTQDTTTYLDAEKGLTTVVYERNRIYDPIFFIDPRVLVSYALNENNRIQGAVNISSQNTHCINYVNYFLPVGIWTTSNAYLKPERNYSQSAGWLHTNRIFESSFTVFNRFVSNVIDYASPVFTSSQDIESNLLTGNLHAYGFEAQVNFNKWKNYSASVSYTYTKTSQFIPGINNDKPYVVANDMPHYFTFSQFFVASEKWRFASNLVVHSGAAITLPNGQFVINGTVFPLFPTARNAERLPYSARLDIAFTRQLGVRKKRNRCNLVFTVTNLFARVNPSVVYVDKKLFTSNTFQVNAIDYAPFMISINLNYKF